MSTGFSTCHSKDRRPEADPGETSLPLSPVFFNYLVQTPAGKFNLHRRFLDISDWTDIGNHLDGNRNVVKMSR